MNLPRHIVLIPAFFPTQDRPTLGIFFRDQAELLGRMGFDVHVIHLETRPLHQLSPRKLWQHHFQIEIIQHPHFTEHRQHGWNTAIQSETGAKVWMELCRRLGQQVMDRLDGPMIVHAHNAVLAGGVGEVLARSASAPLFITEHSSSILAGRLRAFERAQAVRSYRGATGVVAVSSALADRIHELTSGEIVPKVIPNPIDTAHFTLTPAPDPRPAYRFGMVCNLVPIKRIELALQAIASLKAEKLSVALQIGGTGPLEGWLQQMSIDLGLSDIVTFLGATDRNGTRNLIAGSNCILVTSDHETFSMISAEAMAMGRPVIATDCGGPRDFIVAGAGHLVPPGNLVDLQDAMRSMVQGWRSDTPSQIRAHIEKTCGTRTVGSLLTALYTNTSADC